jgi:multicomponent Na+:H+ antiporter subunit E
MTSKPSKLSQWVYTFGMYLLIWYGFTTSLDVYELATGVLVAVILAFFTLSITKSGMSIFSPVRVMYMLQFIGVFFVALLKANWDVAKRVINPKLPINPGIVKFQTQLRSEFAQMVLANAITLTPGTVTIDIIDNWYYIHWIDVESEDPEVAFRAIAEPFEKVLLKIYQ